jgi:hypothetical protein
VETLESKTMTVEEPVDLVCHKLGGVVAIASGFNIEVYNIKGLSLYDTFCFDKEISLFNFTESGKQIVAACDNKLRVATVKTNEITKVGGSSFHKG